MRQSPADQCLLVIQPSACPLSSHATMTSYSKSLRSYAQACHQQVEEAFLDSNSEVPVGHNLEPDDWAYWKRYQRKPVFEAHWKDLSKCS